MPDSEPWPEARIIADHYRACYGVVPDSIEAYVAELDDDGWPGSFTDLQGEPEVVVVPPGWLSGPGPAGEVTAG